MSPGLHPWLQAEKLSVGCSRKGGFNPHSSRDMTYGLCLWKGSEAHLPIYKSTPQVVVR
ncbi:hypothetical protein HAX54_006219, partial [Datura stramonium]|nr:hypothetical protein [Datura stramonium]